MKNTLTLPKAWCKAGASFALFSFLLLPASPVAAQKTTSTTAAAPGAGGYNTDFGTDFGVGKRIKVAGREPAVAVGFKGKTPTGSIPWIGLRFADSLSQRLEPVMGRTMPTSSPARFLATRGLRAQDLACPAENANIQKIPALVALRADSQWRKRSDIVLLGEVLVKGVSSNATPVAQADALMRDGATLTVRVRALRNRPGSLVSASNIVVVQAPGREWGQLPARVALALLDDMRVTITEDERSDLLRDASPLLTSASQTRVRTESRFGAAIAEALDSQVLNAKARAATTAAQRLDLSRQALLSGQTAQRDLRQLINRPAAATIRDGDIFASMNESARGWLAFAVTATATAQRNLKR